MPTGPASASGISRCVLLDQGLSRARSRLFRVGPVVLIRGLPETAVRQQLGFWQSLPAKRELNPLRGRRSPLFSKRANKRLQALLPRALGLRLFARSGQKRSDSTDHTVGLELPDRLGLRQESTPPNPHWAAGTMSWAGGRAMKRPYPYIYEATLQFGFMAGRIFPKIRVFRKPKDNRIQPQTSSRKRAYEGLCDHGY